MKKQLLSIILGLLSIFSFAQNKDLQELSAQFEKIISQQFKANEPGATVLVSRKGEVIYKKAFGLANMELNVNMRVENVFRIGSITKQFTAIAILQLMEEGKLNLQDEISRFIPDYPSQVNKITIEHLLTHTSGILDYTAIRDTLQTGNSDLSPTQMIDRFKNLPLRFAPGTKWEYSNSGYFLLGYIIEKISGKTYGSYLEDNIFKPLAMTSSQYANDRKLIRNRVNGYTAGREGYENAAYLSMTQPYAAGSILSTVQDLFKWQQAVLSYKLVKQETLDKAFKKYKLTDGKETAYGYGWRLGNVYDKPSIWHGGLINGFRSMAIYLPQEDVYVAVLSNCDCNALEGIPNRLAALAAGRPYKYNETTLPNNTIQGYTGVYENQKGQQRIITFLDNKLFSQLGRGPKSLLKAYQKDRFYFDADAMTTIDFTSGSNGSIENLTTADLRGNVIWNKTDKPVPNEDGIKLADDILEAYLGLYEVSPHFSFSIMKEQGRLFLKATGQEKVEIFAEAENRFFLKVNDAELEFVKDNTGKVSKAILNQGGRATDAKKIKRIN